jgi:cytidylate kinase
MTASVAQLAQRQIRLWQALKAEKQAAPFEAIRRPCITLSREAGIDSGALARSIAERLGYSVWEHQVLDFVASTVGVQRQLFESLESQKQNAVERWVEGALRGHLVDGTDYARALVHVLRTLGEQGGVIIVGRVAHLVLSPDATVRVRLVASLEWRAERGRREGESLDDALRRVDREDRLRVEFVRNTLKGDPTDSARYDLVLNVERIPPAVQERIILEALHARF